MPSRLESSFEAISWKSAPTPVLLASFLRVFIISLRSQRQHLILPSPFLHLFLIHLTLLMVPGAGERSRDARQACDAIIILFRFKYLSRSAFGEGLIAKAPLYHFQLIYFSAIRCRRSNRGDARAIEKRDARLPLRLDKFHSARVRGRCVRWKSELWREQVQSSLDRAVEVNVLPSGFFVGF